MSKFMNRVRRTLRRRDRSRRPQVAGHTGRINSTEKLEDRQMLTFGGIFGQLRCETIGEKGRLDYEAASLFMENRSGTGGPLAGCLPRRCPVGAGRRFL